MSPLLACMLLAIEVATTAAELATWWRQHQVALRRLTAAELAVVVAAKEQRKARLA